MSEHCIKIEVPISSEEQVRKLQALGERLEIALDDSDIGEFDGDEYSSGHATLYLYAPNADALFAVIRPILEKEGLPSGTYALLRYGPPNDETIKSQKISLT